MSDALDGIRQGWAICTHVETDPVYICGVSDRTVERQPDGQWLCKRHQPSAPAEPAPDWMHVTRRTF